MNCSTKDIVDAIITAGARRGSDGRGKDELDGRMFMLARTDPESFGILLVAALRLKMKAKPEHWAAGKKYLTEEELRAGLRESGISEEVIKYMHYVDCQNLPAELLKDAEPNGTRQVVEATINAAIRHGSDRHGTDGLVGYMLVLQQTTPKTFIRLMEMAQQRQVATPNKLPIYRTEEEMRAGLREAGLPENLYELMHPEGAMTAIEYRANPYDDPEADEEG
jgi:hypothetical protein